jgi:hypothetical protein
VMAVVPTFAQSKQCDEEIIATTILGRKLPVSHQVHQ